MSMTGVGAGRLAGRVALVTGASANIGGALAQGLAREGARVVCTNLSAPTAARITADGGEAIAVDGDVTDEAHAAEAVQEAVRQWSRIDMLVNNAVQFNRQGLLTMPVEQFTRQVDIILGGAFLFTRAVAPAMISAGHGGSIVNVLSTAAWQGQPGNIGYSTAKSGLINFTHSAAMELAAHGIRVNGLTPTATQPEDSQRLQRFVEAQAKAADDEYPMYFTTQSPMGRLPTPSDYAGALVFLASDDSAMVTGTDITVDAG